MSRAFISWRHGFPVWCDRIPFEDVDQRRAGPVTGVLDQLFGGYRIIAGLDLGDACSVGRRPQDVGHLMALRNGVQVGSGGVAGGLRRQASSLDGRIFRGAVCVH